MDAKERCAETVPPDGMRKSDAPNGTVYERATRKAYGYIAAAWISLDDTLNRTQNAIPLAYSALP